MKGRRTLFSSSLQTRICKLLARGHTVKTSCDAAGISDRTFHTWTAQRPAFLAATQRARSAGRMKIVEAILDCSDWRALAWYLERSDPEQWGRSEPRQIIIAYQPQPPAQGVVPVSEQTRWFKDPIPPALWRSGGGDGAEE
jgi:hypothetical protein